MLLPSPSPQAWTRRERVSRGAEGRSGVAHKLLWKDSESTRVGPQNVGGGSQDPVTRCWSVGEGVVRHLFGNRFLSFYFQFFYAETFKNDLHTQMVFWGSKKSELETEFFLRLRGPPWWKPIRSGRARVPATRGWVSRGARRRGVAHILASILSKE